MPVGENIIALSLRFNLNDTSQRNLWEAINHYNESVYKSKNQFLLSVISDFFEKEDWREKINQEKEQLERLNDQICERVCLEMNNSLNSFSQKLFYHLGRGEWQRTVTEQLELPEEKNKGVSNLKIMGMMDDWNDKEAN